MGWLAPRGTGRECIFPVGQSRLQWRWVPNHTQYRTWHVKSRRLPGRMVVCRREGSWMEAGSPFRSHCHDAPVLMFWGYLSSTSTIHTVRPQPWTQGRLSWDGLPWCLSLYCSVYSLIGFCPHDLLTLFHLQGPACHSGIPKLFLLRVASGTKVNQWQDDFCRAAEMVQVPKCLLHNCGDLSLDPWQPWKKEKHESAIPGLRREMGRSLELNG